MPAGRCRRLRLEGSEGLSGWLERQHRRAVSISASMTGIADAHGPPRTAGVGARRGRVLAFGAESFFPKRSRSAHARRALRAHHCARAEWCGPSSGVPQLRHIGYNNYYAAITNMFERTLVGRFAAVTYRL